MERDIENLQKAIDREHRSLQRQQQPSSKSQKYYTQLFQQRQHKLNILEEYQSGPNAPAQIDVRLAQYKRYTLELLLRGIHNGEKGKEYAVYSFISLWFQCLDE